MAVVLVALVTRLLFLALIGNTYDFDEFVLLQLGRSVARGATPYASFHFFHPPGALELYAALSPLTDRWWPAARLFSALVDTGTAALVWLCATRVWSPRHGLLAGLAYALNPLALVAAARVGQDPIITFLGLAGASALLCDRTRRGAMLAGFALGLACWFKYPAILFAPVYILLAPRRGGQAVAIAAGVFGILLLPYHAEWSKLYADTVTFQRTRWVMATAVRVETTVFFWGLVNLPGLVGLVQCKGRPRWISAGYLIGLAFVFTSQVYYHYFVPVVPFAAILAAPALAALGRLARRTAAVCGILLVAGWAAWLNWGGASPLYVTAAHLSDIQSTVAYIDSASSERQRVMADRFEYAYLSNRPPVLGYFWNVGTILGPRAVERLVPRASLVILSYGASSNYPPGFTRYMNVHFTFVQLPANRVWRVHPRAGG